MPPAIGPLVTTMDRPRKSRFKRWLPRVAVFFACVVATALVTQGVYDYRTIATYPVPGRLVDIGGRNLHVVEKGSGPTVIFEAGGGGGALDWAVVTEKLAPVAHTFCYDRAGNGWSDPGPGPRTSRQFADELHLLLQKSAVSPPYVLVGHSIGGRYLQAFVHQYPNEVAGMVLVDSVHPDQARRLAGATPDMYYLALSMAPFGIQRMFIHGDGPTEYPPELWTAYKAMAARSQSVRAFSYELHGLLTAPMDDTLIQPFAKAIPLVVLTHGIPMPGHTPEKSVRIEHEWLLMQKELAACSPLGVQRVVPNSSHHIPFDQPAEVVAAVNEVLRRIPERSFAPAVR